MIHRDDIPNLSGHDIPHDEINVLRAVWLMIGAPRHEAIAAACGAINRLYLYPPETLAGVEDEVVRLAVSIGLGHAETQACRFVQESEFGQLAFLFFGSRSAYQGRDLPHLLARIA